MTAYRVSLKSLARRYLELTDEIVDLDELINPIVKALAPQLLERVGIGIEVAGQMLVTVGDNSDRMKSSSWVRDALWCCAATRILRHDATPQTGSRR